MHAQATFQEFPNSFEGPRMRRHCEPPKTPITTALESLREALIKFPERLVSVEQHSLRGLKPGHSVAICGATKAAPFQSKREDLDLCGDSLAINLAPSARKSQQFCPESISIAVLRLFFRNGERLSDGFVEAFGFRITGNIWRCCWLTSVPFQSRPNGIL
jgi:hypothetical protein